MKPKTNQGRKRTPWVKSPEWFAIRLALLSRCMNMQELSKATGLGFANLCLVIAGKSPCTRSRRKIEAFLRQPFWSNPADFASRLPLLDFFGFDIEACTRGELFRLLKSRGVKASSIAHLAELRALLRAEYERHAATAKLSQDENAKN